MRTIPNNPYRLDEKSEWMQRQYQRFRNSPYMPSVGCYNITMSHEHKFMWYRVAKVGTRTILNHLKECGAQLDVEHGSSMHYPVNAVDNYFKFAFVRNPWDRLVSCWRDKVADTNLLQADAGDPEVQKSFSNFIEFVAGLDIAKCNRHLRLQCTLVDLNMIDYLGRMENFERDANTVFAKLGFPKKEIKRRNATPSKTGYQEYYNDHSVSSVAEIYQKDIQIFGYEF